MELETGSFRKAARLHRHIDNFRTHARTKTECEANLFFLKNTLKKAGFVLSEKTPPEASQVLKFLGIINNLNKMVYTIPETKKVKYQKQLDILIRDKTTSLTQMAAINGGLAHISIAMGLIMSVLTRSLNDTIAQFVELYRWEQDPRIKLSPPVLRDLERIRVRWDSLDNFPIHWEIHIVPVKIVAHDASANGAAAMTITVATDNRLNYTVNQLVRIPFTEEEQQASSTLREPWALIHYIHHFRWELKGKTIQSLTDSQALEACFARGSKARRLTVKC
jgi:hypothetical protein